MKYVLPVCVFLFVYTNLYAPNNRRVYIEVSQPIDRYERLIQAVVMVESSGNVLAYNAEEGAVGAFQIRQIRVDHYNRLTGKNYCLDDMYNYEIAKEVFMYFAEMFQDFETVARRWNGSGPMTDNYWIKVKRKL